MEFLKANYINTTGVISVNSNTGTSQNLFNRDPLYQYYSDQLANDNTTCSIQIDFGATLPVSRIALIDTNFKQFNLFYNGLTANSFALTEADTSSSSYLNNADANKFFRFPTQMCYSVTVQCKSTIVANQEKLLGLFLISDAQVTLDKIPNAQAYKPKVVPKQVVHKLSDGGTRVNTVRRKNEVTMSLNYVSSSQKDELYELYIGSEFNFVPFGTATGWDGFSFEAVWDGSFDFNEYSDNASSSGFSGRISLKETPV